MKLKYLKIGLLAVAPLTLGLSSCEEKSTSEQVAEDIEEATDDAGDGVEEAGDAVEDAVEDVKDATE